MKHLLIVYHSQTGNTERLAQAAKQGARNSEITGVSVRTLRARDAGPDDLRWANGILLGTPENFGYMSGALKDFFDRTFYAVEGELRPLPYALFVSASNDGSGAVRGVERIVGGYPFIAVQPPTVIIGRPDAAAITQCADLGMTLSAGLEAGIY